MCDRSLLGIQDVIVVIIRAPTVLPLKDAKCWLLSADQGELYH